MGHAEYSLRLYDDLCLEFVRIKGAVRAGLPAYELPCARLNRPYPFACAFNIQDALIR